MQSLVITNSTVDYSTKESGPIVLALAFVIALGGVTAAAIVVCGWGRIKSVSVSWSRKSVEILCR